MYRCAIRTAENATSDVAASVHKDCTVRVGQQLTPFSVPCHLVPPNTFVGAFIRAHMQLGERQLDIPARSAAFFRLLCAFWEESQSHAPVECEEYQVIFETFAESFGSEPLGTEALTPAAAEEICLNCGKFAMYSEEDEEDGRCQHIAKSLAQRHPEVIPSINRALASHLDATRAIEHSRVTLVLRGGFILIDGTGTVSTNVSREDNDKPTDIAPRAPWTTTTSTPTIVNEIRVRKVGLPPVRRNGQEIDDEGDLFFSLDDDGDVCASKRLLPAFTLWGRPASSKGVGHKNFSQEVATAPDWCPLCHSMPHVADALEVRLFISINVPRRPPCPEPIEAALLELNEVELWEELDFHLCDDLTFALARSVLARKSKLKSFLMVRRPAAVTGPEATGARAQQRDQPEEPRLLKQWPGKDAVQALAVWWIAALLVEGHRYTEAELYALIERCCAMQPDYAVIRKEMVRRGYLEAPEIVQNPDSTTTTYYQLSVAGMRAALQGEWRTKGVF